MAEVPVLPLSNCPVCDAADAYVAHRADADAYFIECVNCGVYEVSRKAKRHFEYLRWRAKASGLNRLDSLARALHARRPGARVHLEFDTWQQLI
jgi:Zn ribbon nucleic-acid-binding protein